MSVRPPHRPATCGRAGWGGREGRKSRKTPKWPPWTNSASGQASCVTAITHITWWIAATHTATRGWWRSARAADGQTYRNKARRIRRRGARALGRWVKSGRLKVTGLAKKLRGAYDHEGTTTMEGGSIVRRAAEKSGGAGLESPAGHERAVNRNERKGEGRRITVTGGIRNRSAKEGRMPRGMEVEDAKKARHLITAKAVERGRKSLEEQSRCGTPKAREIGPTPQNTHRGGRRKNGVGGAWCSLLYPCLDAAAARVDGEIRDLANQWSQDRTRRFVMRREWDKSTLTSVPRSGKIPEQA